MKNFVVFCFWRISHRPKTPLKVPEHDVTGVETYRTKCRNLVRRIKRKIHELSNTWRLFPQQLITQFPGFQMPFGTFLFFNPSSSVLRRNRKRLSTYHVTHQTEPTSEQWGLPGKSQVAPKKTSWCKYAMPSFFYFSCFLSRENIHYSPPVWL